MTETATDKRIDELSKRVDFGFEQVGRRLGVVEHRFDRIEGDIGELRAGQDLLRNEIKAGDDAVRLEMREGFASLNESIAAANAELRRSIEGIQTILLYFLAGLVSSIVGGIALGLVTVLL